MQSLTSLDIYKLLDEISYMDGGFIRNIKSRKNEFYFLIYKGKEYWLKIVPGSYFCVVNEKPEDSIDFGFTLLVKNALKGKRFSISMHNSDRILEIKTDSNKLVIEMFSKGNVILLKDEKIERALFQRKFESREISSGGDYVYPPGNKKSFNDMYGGFYSILKTSDKESIVKSLAIDFSMGGYYAEEACFRAKVDKSKKPAELNPEESKMLREKFLEIVKENKPNIIDKNIFSAIELKHIEGKKEYFNTINSAVMDFFEKPAEIERKNPVKIELNKAQDRLKEYEEDIEFINSNYERIENAIEILKLSGKSISERRKELDSLGFIINEKNITPKERQKINIDITQSLNYNLSVLYQKAKRLKNIDTEAITSKTKMIKRIKVKAENQWYSKFRHFITSNGRLTIIGKDVNQNESLIEKHVEKNDLIGHADVFGSPFGVIKADENNEINRKDMEEAAVMIASYSSAWRAGAANLDVYFVKPEQVTKTPPSGEYLKKGAFYIDGKRDYVKSAQLGIYISVEIREEVADLKVAPYEPGTTFFLIKPGNKKREEIIRKINRALSQKYSIQINEDYIDRLIPQGKSSIDKIKLT
ncbi:MAG: NFACT family protein [Candidatus Parvarchaeota archaeon]|nr:NFACT family protein [Candidatus Parvarchaeota archaeon]